MYSTAAVKDHFTLPAGHYLLSHSVGCAPRGLQSALEKDWLGPWQRGGGEAWPEWLAVLARFREVIATLLGGEAACVCPQVNVSSGLVKLLHGLAPDTRRRRIVLCEEDFPSLGFVAAAAQRAGLEPDFIPRGPEPQRIDGWARRLDASCRVAIITHAFSNRSARLPVREITALCRERGVVSVVDVAQTAGAIPIDVTQWSADFVLGSCIKFLCGGPGAGFLWASREAIAASRPLDVGWFSHADPGEFDIRRFRFADDALRFLGGTPSIVPFAAAAFSVATLLRIGIGRIHEHNQALIGYLLDSLPAAAIASEPDAGRRGNTVLLRVADADRALARLRQAGVFADQREGCLRASPHIYNDRADIDALLAAVRLAHA